MPNARETPPGNHLMNGLPQRDRARLLALCTAHELILSEVICEPGEPMSHVYFPTEGFISLLTVAAGTHGLEVGMVGSEGMLGSHVVLGVATAPLRALVQGAGSALRIEWRACRAELARSPALQRALGRYVYVLMAQHASSAACLRFHAIGPRLARWLLMSQDRARSATFPITQEFLAYMLGVRRVGVTEAAGALQQAGLIEYHRGALTVRDRDGLEAAACTCYAADRLAYDALL
ncbi:MAG: Crp/Fnr family transcriptional regulator [Burkholderiales bacterium]|nr:Crp/Fnr family transcriptional regulator [Burkholderiales bacterium]